jgi:Zn-dependent M16 (insulinase) family peptidase
MSYKAGQEYHGFKLLEETKIDEIQSVARVFYHVKSGARLLHLENKDDNKVFSIAFRTTPTDSTGLPHILEHSVLCGSRKFQTKDPFGDVAKSSLNTFLNAMTYPDKTMYPVSSRNHSDFMNLMDVYLDAVLYPNIYKNHNILRQEGWRYEIDEETDRLSYNGVVYSEMQGAFSSPEQVLAENIYSSLFPNTTYAFVSGGDPEVIPQLTQEDFEKFHSKYYHPSNSYIYLYGDQDLWKCLKFINDNYLVNFNAIEIPSHIDDTDKFERTIEQTFEYPISAEGNDENKGFLALNFACGESRDGEINLAMKILYNLLIESSASPIKLALLKEGIGESILTFNDMNMDSTKQLIFTVPVKNVDINKKDLFKKVVFNTLNSLVNNGIDRSLLEASINSIEFNLREADYWGSANKGLFYGIKLMDSWLYDCSPLVHLEYENNLNKIKNSINNNYFENFIKKYILNNNHCSLVTLKPVKGLAERKAKALEEKLQNYKASLSEKELKDIREISRQLKIAQTAQDTEAAKDTIPKLAIEEVSTKVEEIPQVVTNEKGVTILSHNMHTNKIAYINLLFDASIIKDEHISYLALLRDVLSELDTEKRTYSELVTAISRKTGGITFNTEVYSEKHNIDVYHPKFIVKSKVLLENIPYSFKLINEIITSTKFNNTKRVKEIIQEIKSKLQVYNINSGHKVAAQRAYACFSKSDKYREMIIGASYYEFLCDLEKNFESKQEEIQNNLKEVYKTIFNKKNLLISFVGGEEEKQELISNINIVLDNLNNADVEAADINFNISKKTEALMADSNLQYVVKAFNLFKLNSTYSGKMRVLEMILSLEYLHNRVRVQGGAYGGWMEINKNGNIAFVSYRDPNLPQTIKIYDEAYKFLENINFTKNDMEKFIIGAIGKLDRPLTPYRKGEKAVENYICGITCEDIQRERNELLNTTLEDIKSYTDMIKSGMEQNFCCILGNEGKIKENKFMFDKLTMIL